MSKNEQIQVGTTEKGEIVIAIPSKVFATVSTEQDVILTFTAAQARSLGRQLDDLAWTLRGMQLKAAGRAKK